MKSWKMVAIVNVILIPITMVMVVSGTPRYTIGAPALIMAHKKVECLLLGQPCMESKAPCCTLTYQKTFMRVNTVPTTCFKFGKGVCQVNESIDNLEKYNKLIKQLNGTNYQELKNKYLSSIPIAYTCPQKMIIELNSG